MQYFVLTPDGQKFGPVDIMTLNKWVGEGRILAHTVLEEAGTMRRLTANQIPGLALPNPNAYQSQFQPSPRDYPHIVDTKGDKYANTAQALGICGLFLCPLLSLIGIVYAVMALQLGSMKAKRTLILCVLTLLVPIIAYALLMASLPSLTGGI